MRRTCQTGLAVFASLAVLASIGCGSDNSESSTERAFSEDVIVKSDFIQAANAACEHRGREIREKTEHLIETGSGKSAQANAKAIIDNAVAPGFEAEVKDLRELTPPSGDEDEVEEVINAIEHMVKRTRKDLANGRDYPYRKTENLAAAYGLPACGRPLVEE